MFRDPPAGLRENLLSSGALTLAMLVAASCGKPPRPEAHVKTSPPPAAELVLVQGSVVTLDGREPNATAVAIRAGRIIYVGSDAGALSLGGSTTKIIGLAGKTVVPGLVDAHMHLLSLGQKRSVIDLDGTTSLDEIRQKVGEAAKNAASGSWVIGRGWDQNDWTGKQKGQFPSAKDLDPVSQSVPVVLTRIDGHAAWANSKAMALAGIDKNTQAPAGGQILKRGGVPTGVFVDNAMSLVPAQVPMTSKPELKRAFRIAQDECLKAGLVEVHDMGIGPSELEALVELDEANELKLRVYALLDGGYDQLGTLLAKGPRVASEKRMLTVRGVKFFVDGALGSRGALLHEPYSDDSSTHGLLVTDLDFLEARARSAKEAGFQVAIHAIGDRGNTLVLDLFERVFQGDKSARPRVEHAQVIAPNDLARFGAMGVIASMQPVHATSDMPWAEARVGPLRIAGAYAWRSLLSSNATIAAGSDAPVEDISPIAGLFAAIARQDANGHPEGGWRPEERMTPIEALAAFTRGAAYAGFVENDRGKIAEGFAADLTVLDTNPLTAEPLKLKDAKPMITIVGGTIAWARPGADAPPKPPEKVAPKPVEPKPVEKTTPKTEPEKPVKETGPVKESDGETKTATSTSGRSLDPGF
ncbi:MAG: amidohydrolase family protein [Deltaproteobacteria bacterium]|nr:amidohydrolase family protein [Deltaproteobacteria bacterium]